MEKKKFTTENTEGHGEETGFNAEDRGGRGEEAVVKRKRAEQKAHQRGAGHPRP